MNSRERFVASINHKKPDRVPIDLGATNMTGIHICAINRLRQYYGLPQKDIEVFELMQLIGCVDDDLLQCVGGDVVGLRSPKDILGLPNRGAKQKIIMPDGTVGLINANHVIEKRANGSTIMYPQGNVKAEPSLMMPENGYFFDVIDRSVDALDEDVLTPREDFKAAFGLYTDDEVLWLEKESRRLFEETQYGIIGVFGGGSIGDPAVVPGPAELKPKGIRSFEEWNIALALYPEYVQEVFDMWTENCLKNLEIYRQATGDRIQAIVISGTDFGSQESMLMGLPTFRELYKPYYTKINKWVHENTPWKTFFHSCGAIYNMLDDFVEMGVDIINPVQFTAKGMNPALLKEKYGGKLVFWGGGVDTQGMLPNGTIPEIKEQVKSLLDVFAKDGGYVFNTVHNIMGDVKAENIAAAFETAKNYNC